MSFLWRKADFPWFPKHWFIAADIFNLEKKMNTRSRANEGGNMYRESDVGHKNDKGK
jgi:hypothetical protein